MNLFKKKPKQTTQVISCSICNEPWQGQIIGPLYWLIAHNKLRHDIRPMSIDYRPEIVPDPSRMDAYRATARARYRAKKKLAQGELKLD